MTKHQVRIGRPVKLIDPVYTAVRFFDKDRQVIVGAGGLAIPRMLLEEPGIICTTAHKCKDRVLLHWPQAGNAGMWLDADQLEPVKNPTPELRTALVRS